MPQTCPQCGLDLMECRCPNLSVDELARHLFAREQLPASFDDVAADCGLDALLPYYAMAQSILDAQGPMQ